MKSYIENNPAVESKISYIYNPTPFESVEQLLMEKENILLAVGRLVKLKGYHHLIDIWAIIEKKCPNWQLYIVGEGEERNSLENKIKELKLRNIKLQGETSQIDEYYKRASILVSTSDREGLPMNMIEAQSFGIPIVSYDYYTGPRDIIDNGNNGFIVSASTQNEKNKCMAEAIMRLIQDRLLWNRFSKSAFLASRRFGLNNIGHQWSDLFHNIIQGKKS